MKTQDTFPGKTYAVTSPNGCTVTTDDGLTLAEIEAGKQGYFVAVSGNVTLSDADAKLTEVFKLAPCQKLRLLGVVGGDNAGLPAGYKRVEYLESTGTQWILTEYYATSETRAVIDILAFGFPEQPKGLLGNAAGAAMFRFFYKEGASFNVLFDYNQTRYTCEEVPRNIRFTVTLGNGLVLYDAREIFAFSDSASWRADSPMCLFISSANYAYKAEIRMFSARFYEREKLVAEFLPCLDETGAPCMFDTVSKTPFYNKGTGDFTYPTASTTYSRRRVLPDWGKLTETGLRRLYHSPAGYKGELIDYALKNGYKPIIEPEKPEHGYWAPRWTETEDEIVLEWVETEPPMDEFGMPAESLTNE